MRILLLAVLLVPTLASADNNNKAPDASQMKHDDCAAARKANKVCVLDMGKGDDIEGDKPIATDEIISFRDWAKNQSLIHIRKDFIVEILKTAEDIE